MGNELIRLQTEFGNPALLVGNIYVPLPRFCVRSFHWRSSLGLSHPITIPSGRMSFLIDVHGKQNEHVSAPSRHILAVPQAQLRWYRPCGGGLQLGGSFQFRNVLANQFAQGLKSSFLSDFCAYLSTVSILKWEGEC